MLRQINTETGICFFKVTEAASMLQFLAGRDFEPLPTPDIASLMEFGALYIDGLRQRRDVPLKPEQVLRVHTRPKRFPHPASLLPHLALVENEFLVLDKPAGLPTHPTLDNYLENAKTLLEGELGQPLYTTHRLDVPTQGLLIFAKTPDAQRLINKMFAKGRVQKMYRARNEKRVEPGLYVHYMDGQSRVPKTLSAEAQVGWQECRLQVEQAWPQGDGSCAHELRLLTGRTHQIRAQMAALGAPVVGDTVYGSGEKKNVLERIELECFRLAFIFRSGTFQVVRRRSIVPG
jgi:23S rRNA pseudouridine1911/1915/1917 synthase